MKLLLIYAVALAACQSNTAKKNADETNTVSGSTHDSITSNKEKTTGTAAIPLKQPDANTPRETTMPTDAKSPDNKNTVDEDAQGNTTPNKLPAEINQPANKNDQPTANGPERNYPDTKGNLDDTAAENGKSKNNVINPSVIKIKQEAYPAQKGNLDDTAAEKKQFKRIKPVQKKLIRQ